MTVAMIADGRKQDEHTSHIILSAPSVRDKASSHRRQWLTTSSHIKATGTYSGTNQTGRVYALIITIKKLQEVNKMSIRTKVCPVCGKDFSYVVGKGNDRKYCSNHCYKEGHKILAKDRYESLPKCKVDGCNNRANRVGHGMCEACYYRQRRIGTTERKAYKFKYITGAGYIKLYRPDHPLSDSNGNVYEHRMVMYEAAGNGEQKCIWCGKIIGWDKLVIDHLNENKQDNSIENLVISCNDCNRARGAVLPFIERLSDESLALFIKQATSHHKARKHKTT